MNTHRQIRPLPTNHCGPSETLCCAIWFSFLSKSCAQQLCEEPWWRSSQIRHVAVQTQRSFFWRRVCEFIQDLFPFHNFFLWSEHENLVMPHAFGYSLNKLVRACHFCVNAAYTIWNHAHTHHRVSQNLHTQILQSTHIRVHGISNKLQWDIDPDTHMHMS